MYAKDLEGMQAKIQAAGGKITVQIFSYPGGRRFHFSDPEGNVLAVCSDPK
jgi:predicted enzyme related to lactoylglutathione lyase